MKSPYERLTDYLIELREKEKRLTEIWKRAHLNNKKIEGWDDDESH